MRGSFGERVQYFNPEPQAFHSVTANLEVEMNSLLGWSDKHLLAVLNHHLDFGTTHLFIVNAYFYNALDEEIHSPEFVGGSLNSIPNRQGRGVYVEVRYHY